MTYVLVDGAGRRKATNGTLETWRLGFFLSMRITHLPSFVSNPLHQVSPDVFVGVGTPLSVPVRTPVRFGT